MLGQLRVSTHVVLSRHFLACSRAKRRIQHQQRQIQLTDVVDSEARWNLYTGGRVVGRLEGEDVYQDLLKQYSYVINGNFELFPYGILCS